MSQKKKIPRRIRNEVLREAGHQCGVCGNASDVDVAHIIPENAGGKMEVENLIALCPTHHRKYEREWNDTRPNSLNNQAMWGYKTELQERGRDAIRKRMQKLEDDKKGDHYEKWMTNRMDSLEAENAELKEKIVAMEQGTPEWQAASAKLARKWKAAELYNSGIEAFKKANYPAALQKYEVSRDVDPTWEVFFNLEIVYTNLARYDDALKASDNAERLRNEQGLPDYPGIAMNRGAVFHALGRYEDTLKAYDKSESLRNEQRLPANPNIALNRGVVSNELGRYDDALKAYDEAERLRKEQGLEDDPNITLNRGDVYWHQEKYADALTAGNLCEQQRKQQGLPENHILNINFGMAYSKLGDYDKAENYYSEAEVLCKLQGLPNEPMITFYRGQVLFDQGDTDGACRMAREAREMYKGTQMVVRNEITKFIAEHCGEG